MAKKSLLGLLKDDVEIDTLVSGDFAAIDTPLTLGIEHKTFGDFVGSLSSNRLDIQLSRLVERYDVPVLMVDEIPPERGGKLHLFGARRSVNFNWVFGSIFGWALRGVIPIMVRTPGSVGPAVATLYKVVSKEEHRASFEPQRLLDNLQALSLTERVLMQFPGIGPDRASKFAGHSMEDLNDLDEDTWKTTLGPLTGSRAYASWHGREN